MKRLTLSFALCTLFTGCALDSLLMDAGRVAACSSDSDCSGSQVCFIDGCGDPGESIVAELLINAETGHYEQDYDISELKAVNTLYAAPPTAFSAVVERPTSVGGTPQPYLERVTLRAQGQSDKLPGVLRNYELTTTATGGPIRLAVGSGTYRVSVTPADTSVPTLTAEPLSVEPGKTKEVTLTLSHPDALYRVDAQLVKLAAGPELLDPRYPMDVQALDANSSEALSQRVPVSSATGRFQLAVDPKVKKLENFLILAVPHDANAPVPSKAFLVPVATNVNGPLEMGDFGAPLTVKGKVTASDGRPVAQALVYAEGLVEGGGKFRSQNSTTDDRGEFTLISLATQASGPQFRLSIHPPRDHLAAIFHTSLSLRPAGDGKPVEVGPFVASDKVPVSGVVLEPNGLPAANTQVIATAIETADGSPLPDGMETQTDLQGRYSLLLDPAVYRMDLQRPGTPVTRKFVTVISQPGPLGYGPKSVVLKDFVLSQGRRVMGTVLWRTTKGDLPAPNATIRLFRVGRTSGVPTSILLAEGICDSNGGYSLLIPTR